MKQIVNQRVHLLLVMALVISTILAAQEIKSSITPPKNTSWAIRAGIQLPVGEFAKTHYAGAGVQAIYSPHRLGSIYTPPAQRIGWLATAGYDQYYGKKENVSGYAYQYPLFQQFYAGGGIISNHIPDMQILLSAAPSLAFYDGNTRFYQSARLQGSYHGWGRTGVLAGVKWMKEKGATSLFHLEVACIRVLGK